jgi:hypothetical protein
MLPETRDNGAADASPIPIFIYIYAVPAFTGPLSLTPLRCRCSVDSLLTRSVKPLHPALPA